ncbi:MAG: aspartate-semialdehyde dehydrogenase [Candidatus Margulisbacteria bacterium GWF2_35_9]|nr:MAG: aspartate-semialdehyde dehydrogenase [Candidatus Margulisbacteria bacterium GWF2_35_9]
MKKYTVAVVGATGVVGTEMIKVLEEFKFPVSKLIPLASEKSAGKVIEYMNKNVYVEKLDKNSFKDVDIALFSAGAAISKQYAPIAVKAGAIVIDNTSFFRMDKDIPLVVPEVNAHVLKDHKGIIANPNCSTAQLVLALKPIHDAYKIKRVVVSTYQATSGAGKEAMDELAKQTIGILNGKGVIDPKKFTKQIAFNLIPHIDVFMENDYTKEEMKMTNETKKIMGDDSIELVATCVRVPVFIGHSEVVNIDVEKKFKIEDVKKILSEFPGLKIVDDPKKNEYPTPIDCVDTNDTLVGRIRRDISIENGITMFIVSNNLRKGAASNAVQIALELINQKLV